MNTETVFFTCADINYIDPLLVWAKRLLDVSEVGFKPVVFHTGDITESHLGSLAGNIELIQIVPTVDGGEHSSIYSAQTLRLSALDHLTAAGVKYAIYSDADVYWNIEPSLSLLTVDIDKIQVAAVNKTSSPGFNSGVMFINLEKAKRSLSVFGNSSTYVEDFNSKKDSFPVVTPDESYLNLLFPDFYRLPDGFNVMPRLCRTFNAPESLAAIEANLFANALAIHFIVGTKPWKAVSDSPLHMQANLPYAEYYQTALSLSADLSADFLTALQLRLT